MIRIDTCYSLQSFATRGICIKADVSETRLTMSFLEQLDILAFTHTVQQSLNFFFFFTLVENVRITDQVLQVSHRFWKAWISFSAVLVNKHLPIHSL